MHLHSCSVSNLHPPPDFERRAEISALKVTETICYSLIAQEEKNPPLLLRAEQSEVKGQSQHSILAAVWDSERYSRTLQQHAGS